MALLSFPPKRSISAGSGITDLSMSDGGGPPLSYSIVFGTMKIDLRALSNGEPVVRARADLRTRDHGSQNGPGQVEARQRQSVTTNINCI